MIQQRYCPLFGKPTICLNEFRKYDDHFPDTGESLCFVTSINKKREKFEIIKDKKVLI